MLPAMSRGKPVPAEVISVLHAAHARGLLEDGTWTEWFELETALDPETGDRAPGTEH